MGPHNLMADSRVGHSIVSLVMLFTGLRVSAFDKGFVLTLLFVCFELYRVYKRLAFRCSMLCLFSKYA